MHGYNIGNGEMCIYSTIICIRIYIYKFIYIHTSHVMDENYNTLVTTDKVRIFIWSPSEA